MPRAPSPTKKRSGVEKDYSDVGNLFPEFFSARQAPGFVGPRVLPM